MLSRIGEARTNATLDAGAEPHVLHRDFETRSQAVLKTVGTHQVRRRPDDGSAVLRLRC